ncbi:MAG: tetratricopeptide repeat protein [Pyrinomonadaceae bacterium]
MEKITYYCQKCRAANDPGEVNCWQCGTRLMLVVFPPSVRHEEGIVPSFYEDHLLERVSLLELRLAQVTEQLAMAYEFIQREIKSFQRDHVLMQSFFETLERVNPDFSELLSRECIEIYGEKNAIRANEDKKLLELREILGRHENPQTELFTHLVREGIRLLEEDEEKQGFRTLDRAVLLSPKNAPLLVFIAKKQFGAEKFDEARENLEKAFEIAPHDPQILLLLGVLYADRGMAEKARKLLSVLANDPQTAVCVNLIWGVLAAFEENWTESLAALKESLGKNDIPEIHYLIGSVYYQLGRRKSAIRHLKKAIEEDLRFSDAWFMLSLIYQSLNRTEKAKQARQAALEAREAGAQCLEFLKRENEILPEKALPFVHFNRENKRLLSQGSLRLNKFFRENIFKAVE